MFKMRFLRYFYLFILCVFLILVLIYSIRIFSYKQIDDLSPIIPCEKEYLDKSNLLLVIPLYDNYSISNNRSFCQELLSLNKTIAMHGVYHTYKEFYYSRDSDYIDLGIEAFKECFGFYPKLFEAPQLVISSSNRKLIEEKGIRVLGKSHSIFHKMYHCSTEGKYSYKILGIRITNRLIDFI